jgi:chemotaxis protein methyltransferase CheR
MTAARKFSGIGTERELIAHISTVISEITGVQLGEKQYSLVQGRLARRMRDLKITAPLDYARHLEQNEGVEIGVLTSLLTTHHTYFFREFQHFEFLLKNTLPAIVKSHREKGLDTIRIWSAACSRGQEVYSLAMFLRHHLPQIAPNMKFQIVGSDVCEESVAIAKNGVYTWEEVKAVPSVYLQGSWARGTGEIANFVRAKESIRSACEFKIVNLMDFSKVMAGQRFDVIFCRNVFIYFTQAQIKLITREFLKVLNPAGHLFIGVSESLNGLELPVGWVGPSVYASEAEKTAEPLRTLPAAASPSPQPKATAKVVSLEAARTGKTATPVQTPWSSPRLRVLCVDDSPTILTLFKKMFVPEKGFELVGTAMNGLEAIDRIRALKPDVVTLDIHMPQMNGIQFLESYGRNLDVPVVMVSSVSREESDVAFRCLELGAVDYIEKPSLENIQRIEEELAFKLRCAHEARGSGKVKPKALELDSSFKRSPLILSPAGKLRVVVASFGARDELSGLLARFRVPQPPTLTLLDGAGTLIHDWIDRQKSKIKGVMHDEPASIKNLASNTFSFVEFHKGIELLEKESQGLTVQVLILGPMTPTMVRKVAGLKVAHMMMEDLAERNPPELVAKTNELIPATSFVYESDRFFAKGGETK